MSKTIKRLLRYVFKGHIGKLIIVFISIILSSIASVVGSLFLKKLVDEFITPLLGTENPIYTGLLQALGVMVIIYIVGIISTYLYNRIMAIVAQDTLKTIRNDMFEKMEKLPIKYFDTHSHGDVMSRYINDADTLREMISRSLPQIITSTVTVIAIVSAMLYLNVTLTVFVLLFTGITTAITRRISMKSSKHFVAQQKSLGRVNGFIEEMLSGQKVIKVFTHEEKSMKEFEQINNQLRKDMYSANKYANILMPIAGNLGYLQYVLTALIGTILASKEGSTVTIGAIVSFLQLTRTFNHPINQVMNQLSSIILALAGSKRIFEMMDEEKELDNGYVTLVNMKKENGQIIECKERTGMWAWKYPHSDGRLEYVELKGHIEMENVDFGYSEGKTILHNISLYAKPGQKIAFVGATGAGKTTITNLLNRFYDVEDGKIRYDGININKIKKDDLRKSLGMVLQDTNLFTGTIKDNIKYGKEDATDEEVKHAAKLANAHDFIKRIPNGYDTMLSGNASELSQGQRQLLAIARAAINDPPVMILDEATSSIDTRTEKIVQDGMDKLMEGRTVFVIAHRLSTVRNSKAIMVMDHGRIIERGTHEDLLAQKGQYYQLYTGAFELE